MKKSIISHIIGSIPIKETANRESEQKMWAEVNADNQDIQTHGSMLLILK